MAKERHTCITKAHKHGMTKDTTNETNTYIYKYRKNGNTRKKEINEERRKEKNEGTRGRNTARKKYRKDERKTGRREERKTIHN